MVHTKSIGSKMFDGLNVLVLCCLMASIIYPLLMIISTSLSDPLQVAKNTITVWPKGFTTAAYRYVFQDWFIYKGYLNSILYAVGSTTFMLVFTSLMAYPLTFQDFVAKKFITIFLTITMFFGGGLIPTYLLMRNLHLMDTYWVMTLPGCVAAFNVFLFRTFFQSIPADLRESAVIDGASEIVVLFRIILPLSKAMLATFALFGIVGSWNSWFNGLIYLHDQNKYPLQLILRNYLYTIDTNSMMARAGTADAATMLTAMKTDPKSIRMAAIMVTILPIMSIYPFLQKYFVKGIMIGAIKG